MDDRARLGRCVAERVDVRHDVVAQARLVGGGGREVDVVEVRADRVDLRARDAACRARAGSLRAQARCAARARTCGCSLQIARISRLALRVSSGDR
jgi:hypothetical protein